MDQIPHIPAGALSDDEFMDLFHAADRLLFERGDVAAAVLAGWLDLPLEQVQDRLSRLIGD
jgi:hypothetical protein